MDYRLFCALLLLSLWTGCTPQPLVVVSYNLHALFDWSPSGNEYPGYEPESWRQSDVREKVIRLGRVLRGARRIDVLCVQEVENASAFELLLEEGIPFSGLRHRVFAKKPGAALGVGIASRFPILDAHSVLPFPRSAGARPALWARVDGPRGAFEIVCLHWKSQRGDPELNQFLREKERRALMALLEGRAGHMVVAGDFNGETVDVGGRSGETPATWGTGARAQVLDRVVLFGAGSADWSTLEIDAYGTDGSPIGYSPDGRKGASDHWPVCLVWY